MTSLNMVDYDLLNLEPFHVGFFYKFDSAERKNQCFIKIQIIKLKIQHVTQLSPKLGLALGAKLNDNF